MAPCVIKSYKIYKMASYVTTRGQTYLAPYFIKRSILYVMIRGKIYIWLPTSFKVTKCKWLPMFGNVQYFLPGPLSYRRHFVKLREPTYFPIFPSSSEN